MAKVPPKPRAGKARRFVEAEELLGEMQRAARARLYERAEQQVAGSNFSPSHVAAEQIKWLKSQAREWRPRADARAALDTSEQLLKALDEYARASEARRGASYYPAQFSAISREFSTDLARHVAWLKTLQPNGSAGGRHGWDPRTALIMSVLQQAPNTTDRDLAAMTVAAGLFSATDLQSLFGKANNQTGGKPTATHGWEVEVKRIRELIKRHRPPARRSQAKAPAKR